MASRSLDALAQPVKLCALSFLAECERAGLDVLIYCTLRSTAEQAELYASGRTKRGPILTNARPGESLHNPDSNGLSWAFDAVPTRGGKALWNDDEAIQQMGQIGERAGLEWAGRWRGALRERAHFQIKPKGGQR